MIEATELRAYVQGLALETREDGGGDMPVIRGYAAVFDSLSEDLGGFREIVKPGAFTRSIKKNADVRALVNHDPSQILGRTRAKTLTLAEDDKGLSVEIDPPDTTLGRDIITSIERRDIDSMSFGFITRADEWIEEGGKIVRHLIDVDLFDVSPVTFPAYRKTNVKVAKRSLEQWAKQNVDFRHDARSRAKRLAALLLQP